MRSGQIVYAAKAVQRELFLCARSAGGTGKSYRHNGRDYPWLVSCFGTVNSGSVAVPLDVSLPAEELCELMDCADVPVLVLDELRKLGVPLFFLRFGGIP